MKRFKVKVCVTEIDVFSKQKRKEEDSFELNEENGFSCEELEAVFDDLAQRCSTQRESDMYKAYLAKEKENV